MKIEELPLTERPRERFLNYGRESLSNQELLAILIKNGTKSKSCKDLSLEVLKKINNISELQDITVEQLMEISGIGKVKAVELLASIELGKRIFLAKTNNVKLTLKNAKQIYDEMRYLFYGKKQEYFYCLYFNNKLELIERKLLFMGTINKSIAHPREIFKHAYLNSASSIVCIHNHPSNDIKPSREDINLTRQLIQIGKINGILVNDHIIVGDDSFYSFYEESNLDF